MSSVGIASFGRPTIPSALPSRAAYREPNPNIPISESAGKGEVDLELGPGDINYGSSDSKTSTPRVESLAESFGFPTNITSSPNLATPTTTSSNRQLHPPSGIAIQLARARANQHPAQFDSVPYVSIQEPTEEGVAVPDLNRLESQLKVPAPARSYSYDSLIPRETTPLLSTSGAGTQVSTSRAPIPSAYSSISNHGSALFPDTPPSPTPTIGTTLLGAINQTRKLKQKDVWKDFATVFLSSAPVVIIGLLLNILDGVSC